MARTTIYLPSRKGRRVVKSYATAFPNNLENPYVHGGPWIMGHRTGVDWSDMQVEPGKMYGTQNGNQGAGVYNDSVIAHADPWPANQLVEFQVGQLGGTSKGGTDCYEELAAYLRVTAYAHYWTGYECGFRVVPGNDGSRYCGVTRWNGATGDFTSYDPGTLGPGLIDGDWVLAQTVGDQITVYTRPDGNPNYAVAYTHDCSADTPNSNGVSKHISGAPGVGHWLHNGSTSGVPSDYYFRSVRFQGL